ncbi:MAG: MFS transporter [Acidimicrobiia bacterium]|nr:MFS transporter [Acidimicrobiia bacterium]
MDKSEPKLGPNYRKLLTASVVSNFGDGISTVAYPWLASAVTRDPLQIALVGVATRIPWLVFTLPAGVIADRIDRRKLVGWTDAFRFILTLAVATAVLLLGRDLAEPDSIALGTADRPEHAGLLLAVLYTSALLFGFAEVLRDNAAQTLMPSIVDTSLLEKANGRLWGSEMVMNSLLGPVLGGLIIAVAFSLPFFVDAVTFAISAALLFSLRGSFRAEQAEDRPSFVGQIKQGFGWLWRHRLLRVMGIILGVMNAMFSMALATYVLFVQEILELDASRFGLLMTAGALGGVVASFTASLVSKTIGPGASLFLTLLGSGATLVFTGLTSSSIVVWIMFFIASFLAVLWNVITVSLRQTIIPDALLGRVNSVYRFFAWGMMPLGMLAGGTLVALVEAIWSRDLALRMPFLAGGAVYAVLFVVALPVLNTRQIEQARLDAGDRVPES